MEIFKNISIALNKIVKKIKEVIDLIINAITKKDKWKLYLYIKGQCVKKLYVDDEFKPMEHFYKIKVKRFKHLLGTNKKTQIIVQYYKYKMTDNDKKEVHIETIINEGSDLTV